MKIEFYKIKKIIQFADSVIDSIRILGQIAKTLIIWLTSVDALWGKSFKDFALSLLLKIINNLGVENYPAKIVVEYLCGEASIS